MKGRHVVILIFAFGLSLLAILFRVLPQAKPAPPPPKAPPPVAPPPPPTPERFPESRAAGSIEVVVKSKGAPVAGAAVMLQLMPGTKTHSATSDAEGRCRVASAEAGTWRIVARSGVATSAASVIVEPGKPARVQLDVAAGARLEGTVRDGAGNPVAGAKVSLSLPDPAFTVRTDGNGRYVIADVPTGTHAVTASSERLLHQTVNNLEFTTPGQTVPQDFTLSFGSSIAGRVVDETGAPVARATVTISNEVARMVRSDENGDFRADGLGGGPTSILVRARGYAPARVSRAAGQADPLVIQLVKGATLQGRIDGTPAAFSVHLSRFDETRSSLIVERSTPFSAEANGAFQIRDLPAGTYEMTIETTDRRTPSPVTVLLEAGQAKDAGLIVLTPTPK